MTNLPLCSRTETRIDQIVREFPTMDKAGRRFGARVTINRVEYVELPETATSGYRVQPGVVIEAEPHAMRGGKPYGALQRAHRYANEADARAWAEVYFMQATKRAAKNKAAAA